MVTLYTNPSFVIRVARSSNDSDQLRFSVSSRVWCGGRQMRDAIFLAISRHPKVQVGIGQFGRSANRAGVQGFIRSPCGRFKSLPPSGDFAPLPRVSDDLGTEKDQVI